MLSFTFYLCLHISFSNNIFLAGLNDDCGDGIICTTKNSICRENGFGNKTCVCIEKYQANTEKDKCFLKGNIYLIAFV